MRRKIQFLEIILVYAMKGGISHNQLAQIMDLDRTWLKIHQKAIER